MSQIVKLVSFGNGSDTVEYSKNSRGSGYGTPERPHASDFSNLPDNIVPDGTPVIDKRPALKTSEGVRWVFEGPMVDVDLADGEVDECPEPSPMLAAGLLAEGGSFGAMVALKAAHTSSLPGPLDSVSIRVYLDGWRAVGARTGRYVNCQIVWDDVKVETDQQNDLF